MDFYGAAELQKRVRCFMDGIDWQEHLEGDASGTKLFPSQQSLERSTNHSLEECGIVEVALRLVRWVKQQDLGLDRLNATKPSV